MTPVKVLEVNGVEYGVDIEASATIQEAVDAAEAATSAANTAAVAALITASKSPYIGQNGNWYVWDTTTNQYVDTEIPADAESLKANKADLDNLVDEVAGVETYPSDLAHVADFYAMPKLAGQPMLLFCNGTPTSSNKPTNWIDFMHGGYEWTGLPSAVGQQVLDYTNHVLYFGWLNPSNYTLEWKH